LIFVAREVGLLDRHPKLLKSVEIVRECWRIFPLGYDEIFMKIRVLVISDRHLNLNVIEIDFFDRVERHSI
jgi:hypothetical protein